MPSLVKLIPKRHGVWAPSHTCYGTALKYTPGINRGSAIIIMGAPSVDARLVASSMLIDTTTALGVNYNLQSCTVQGHQQRERQWQRTRRDQWPTKNDRDRNTLITVDSLRVPGRFPPNMNLLRMPTNQITALPERAFASARVAGRLLRVYKPSPSVFKPFGLGIARVRLR